jgi:hypothetical protein
VLAVLGVVTIALGVSACSAVRNDLGTSNGPCYVAIPAATAAVHHTGKLAGLRLERVAALHRTSHLYQVAGGAGAGSQRVCLVAFKGSFDHSGVTAPQGRSQGGFAVVVLSYPDNHVLGTVILRRPPVDFGHSHLL